ncbi:MAG: DUF459 domain-containing protein [Rhodoblastus sp.]|nr:DUF459 domain-containing protein [Rhodoblastus sp.]
MARLRLSFWPRLALPAAFLACVVTGVAHAQDSAQSNASFWLQERARTEHVRPTARQAPRIRRLVPNRQLARPTIWRRPQARPGEERHTTPAAVTPEPTTTPTIAPAIDPAVAAPAPAAPGPVPQQPATADAAPQGPPTSAGAPTSAPQPPAAASPAAVAPAKIPVAVVGDNIGYHLAQGLIDTEADGGLGLQILRKTKDSSGLVRDDFYDWPKNLREFLAGPDSYGAIVVMIGTNDRQELRDAAGRHEPLSPRWKELYKARVDAMVAQLKAKGVPFYWIGLPIMRSERYSGDLQQLNEIYRASVEAAGGKYVDVWDAFADEKGQYNVFGPEVSGQIVKIRTSDGIHFTKSGQRKLAYFVEQAMRGLIDKARPTPDAAIAALPPQQPATQGPAAPTPGAPSATPGPEAAAPAPAPPPKPEFGPVQPLTAPPLAANGELLGPSGPKARAEARATIAPELATGRALAAPTGRADDFSWPRR